MADIEQYLNKIICGDAIGVMSGMPAASVDLLLTDPPYNIGKAAWDKIDNYLGWCGEWITECQRVLKDNGSFYFFHNDMPTIAKLMGWIEQNTDFVFKQLITWNKRFDGMSNKGFMDGYVVTGGLRNYQQMAEYLLFYTFQDETGLSRVYDNRDCFKGIKGYFIQEKERAGLKTCKDVNRIIGSTLKGGGMATHYFNIDHTQWCLPTAEMYAKLQTTGYFQQPYEELRLEYEELRYTFNNQKTHHSVWDYETVRGAQHPTQKPEPLIANIIKHSSNEGDIILDPFTGSGTTAVTCIKTGRKYIGIELSEEYCEIAEKRITAELSQPELVIAT